MPRIRHGKKDDAAVASDADKKKRNDRNWDATTTTCCWSAFITRGSKSPSTKYRSVDKDEAIISVAGIERRGERSGHHGTGHLNPAGLFFIFPSFLSPPPTGKSAKIVARNRPNFVKPVRLSCAVLSGFNSLAFFFFFSPRRALANEAARTNDNRSRKRRQELAKKTTQSEREREKERELHRRQRHGHIDGKNDGWGEIGLK